MPTIIPALLKWQQFREVQMKRTRKFLLQMLGTNWKIYGIFLIQRQSLCFTGKKRHTNI